jgi:hypothetical protein
MMELEQSPSQTSSTYTMTELEESSSQATSTYTLFPYYVQYQSFSNNIVAELEPFQGLMIEPNVVLEFQIFFHSSEEDLSLPSGGMLILSVFHRYNEEATKWIRCYPSYMYEISNDLVEKWNDRDMSGDLTFRS